MTTADPLSDEAHARVGSTVHGKYRIDRLLGIGGMASVYAAMHRNGNRVALKVLHRELAIVRDVRERFLREGYVANRIEHPGAVRVLDDDVTDDGAVFLVMELLEGESVETLRERLGGKLEPDYVARVGLDVLSVLAIAHEKGIVHRDIKPENLFATRDGGVKVLDFGIARLIDPQTNASTTSTGRMVGTPAFMPPEQALGRRNEIDARTDIWALGATLFTLLSGKHVHPAETVEEMMVHAAIRPAPPVASAVEGVADSLAAVIDRALAFTKDARWQSAAEMRAALDAACHPTRALPVDVTSTRITEGEASSLATALTQQRAERAHDTKLVSTEAGVAGAAKPTSRALSLGIAGGATLIGAVIVAAAMTMTTHHRSEDAQSTASTAGVTVPVPVASSAPPPVASFKVVPSATTVASATTKPPTIHAATAKPATAATKPTSTYDLYSP